MTLFSRQTVKELISYLILSKNFIPILPMFLFLIFAGLAQDIKVTLIFFFLFVAFISFFVTVMVFRKMQDGQVSDKPIHIQNLINSARNDLLRMMRAGLVVRQNASLSEYYRLDFHDLTARIENMTFLPVGNKEEQEALYQECLNTVVKDKKMSFFQKKLLDNMMHARLMHTLPAMSAHEVMEMNAKIAS